MEIKPLYRSFRESFSRDIPMPMCGAVAAPVVISEIRSRCALASDAPPQMAILHISRELFVLSESGEVVETLLDALKCLKRSVPVLYFEDEETADALADFVDFHHLADALLCVRYEKRQILASAYRKMPMLRGILDLRGVQADICALPGIACACGATSVILAPHAACRANIDELQRRFIHVIAPSVPDFETMAAFGVNGILTENPDSAYAFLASLPEETLFRSRKLYAHKGFSCDGRYSENTITSVVAAGENHFDGAEIDVKLTADDVPVVMHNVDTRGLFDCETLITEESSYETLSALKRIGFPEESIDRFEDLMHCMKAYEKTPVVIEFKPSAHLNNLEEMLRLAGLILASPESQKSCVCIMGVLPPGHEYLHKKLPYLPMGYCEGAGELRPPENRQQAENLLYRVARLSKGCAAAYNPEDAAINRLFNEYAKFRMLNVFPWSRSWTLEPSKWAENGPSNCETYLSGYDAWTTDHGEKFLHLPVRIEPVMSSMIGMHFRPLVKKIFRDGREETAQCKLHVLKGDVREHADGSYEAWGAWRAMAVLKENVHFGRYCLLYSAPFEEDVPERREERR